MRSLIKYFVLLFNAIIHRDTSPKVVFYHDIGQKYTPMGTPESLFCSHMAYLQEIRKKSLLCSPSPSTFASNAHVVAFDDGFRGIWDYREFLRKYDIHPIVFIAIALVGQPGYLTWNEIRTLQNDYSVDFQCHTWSHQTLIGPVNTDLPAPSDPNFRTDAWCHHELVDSKAELERQLNLPLTPSSKPLTPRHSVMSLSFPVGYFSNEIIQHCVSAGYTNLYASFPGNKDDDKSIVHLDLLSRPDAAACRIVPRILCQSLSLADFKLVLAGGMNPMRKRYLKMHYVEAAK